MTLPHTAPPLPPVIGHRGAAGRAPENTLAGLRRAKELGCTWVEFDVRLTADGVPVLCHDSRLDRTTTLQGTVSALSSAAIQRADAGVRFAVEFAGERVPTLEEALRSAGELGLGVNVELKAGRNRDYATAAAAVAVIERLRGRLPAILVSSFEPAAIDAIRVLQPRVPRGILFRAVPRHWPAIAQRLGCSVIGADHRRLTRRRAGAIRSRGYRLTAYTVNDPARARVLFAWGVASVFSDVPDIILKRSTTNSPAPAPAAAPHGCADARQGAIR